MLLGFLTYTISRIKGNSSPGTETELSTSENHAGKSASKVSWTTSNILLFPLEEEEEQQQEEKEQREKEQELKQSP